MPTENTLTLYFWLRIFEATLILLAITSTNTQAADNNRPDRHVVLVSIDGLRPEIYMAPDKLGINMPTLTKLRNHGVYAEGMIGVFPTITFPSHTSMITGNYPAQHGIWANSKPSDLKSTGSWYSLAVDIESDTLWNAASRAGLTSASLMWPVTYSASIDWLIPEMRGYRSNIEADFREGGTKGLYDRIVDNNGPYDISTYEETDPIEVDRFIADVAVDIIINHRPNLLTIHFYETDSLQHVYGQNSTEAMQAFERMDRYLSRLYQAVLDANIADKTTFMIVGDHGFVDTYVAINLYGIFKQMNPEVLQLILDGFTIQQAGGSLAIIPPSSVSEKIVETVSDQVKIQIEKQYSEIVTFIDKEALGHINAFPSAAFALSATPGFVFTYDAADDSVLVRTDWKGMHGYLPTHSKMMTGFIASGADIQKGLQISNFRMVDVAPTITKILGIELKDAVGEPNVGIFSHDK